VVYRDRAAPPDVRPQDIVYETPTVRDIYLVRREGERWSEPRRVHADNWVFNGCPDNGPAVDADGASVARCVVDGGRGRASRVSRILEGWRRLVRASHSGRSEARRGTSDRGDRGSRPGCDYRLAGRARDVGAMGGRWRAAWDTTFARPGAKPPAHPSVD